jgi:tRNA A-37 threonylcarbamoyl transferase component Bud32
MACVYVNPEHACFLQQHGLQEPEDFLHLSGAIICGHPDRNVSRVTLGTGAESMRTFLKKEHRVRWRDRFANAWAGFGFRSKSCREMALLRLLRQSGVCCPEVIAAGEAEARAFISTREVDDALDLRCVLQQTPDVGERRRLLRQLGEAIARVHAAGFDQPDLYCKHILVRQRQGENRFCFLDWQRSQKRNRVSWSRRCRDLAALDATLSNELATNRERLACLRSYLRAAASAGSGNGEGFAVLARRIRRQATRLLRRRYVRELRQAPLKPREQSLIWLDGEAVCVTPQFQTDMGLHLPAWLEVFRSTMGAGKNVDGRAISLTPERSGYLVRRRELRPWCGLWNWLRGKRSSTPELERAGTLFRLERYGVTLPRLLAVGQRHTRTGYLESFLLTEAAPGLIDLTDWFADRGMARPRQRRHALRQTAELLRRLHQAGYYLDTIVNPRCLFAVRMNTQEQPEVALSSVEGLRRSRSARPKWARADLDRLRAALSSACSRGELLRFCLACLGKRRLDDEAKKTIGSWWRALGRRGAGIPEESR